MSEIDYLLSEYEERMDMLQTALSQGNCTSFEEYRYTCGQIRGLEAACAIIADLKNRMEHSDE
jgi:hypothetical protein